MGVENGAEGEGGGGVLQAGAEAQGGVAEGLEICGL